MTKYNPQKIEKKWQKYWEAKKLNISKDQVDAKKNFMLLAEFPYTSGNLHMGHWFTYSIADIYARYLRMNNHNVMYPIGFDAFGLPAENAAIKSGSTPNYWTERNIKNMTKQLKSIGATFDWSRVVDTSNSDYYKWTQWIFIKLYEKGLVYRGETMVNWCSKDRTVLANEQVVNGCCERCDTPVEQRKLAQWMFKITSFANALADDLKDLDWPEDTKAAQVNWIGRSEGAIVKFPIFNNQYPIGVFTTRPDTLFGATYLVLAPEHEAVLKIKNQILNWPEVKKYIREAKLKTELTRKEEVGEKTGVELKGIKAINPATKEEVPVWIADYVLASYGSGAIMAVPAHDERDFEFAKKFNLPVKVTVEPVTGTVHENEEFRRSIVAVVENKKTGKVLSINWGDKFGGNLFIGGGVNQNEDLKQTALREIREETGYKNLKLISQSEKIHHHYIAYSKGVNRNIEATGFYFELLDEEKDNIVLEKDEQGKFIVEWLSRSEVLLKVKDPLHGLVFQRLVLDKPYSGNGILTNSGKFTGLDSEKAKWEITKSVGGEKKTQYRLRDWILSRQRYWGAPIPMIKCEKCGYQPVAEKDLPVKLPKLDDFLPVEGGKSPLARAEKWVKVKCPNCGDPAERETDTMDTFVDSSWYFMRYTDPANKKEFAAKEKMAQWLPAPLYIGGREHNTMHLLYARFITKALHSLGLVDFSEPFLARRNHGVIMGPDGQKMSKSKGNVVDPDAEVAKYGADTVRMNFAFLGPFEQDYAWNSNNISGISRFLIRVWNFINKPEEPKVADQGVEKILNRSTKEIGENIKNLKFNTGVSGLMKLLNAIEDKWLTTKQYETFIKLLAPFAPHLAEEIWSRFFFKKSRIRDSRSESGMVPSGYKSVHLEKWPEYDEKYLQEEMVDLVVQINGKTRAILNMARDLSEAKVKEIALSSEKVRRHLGEKLVKKIIFVANRLINLIST